MLKGIKELDTWKGDFGKEYTDRNALSFAGMEKLYKDNYGITRTTLNKRFLNGIDRKIKILEVGSNIGNQLVILQKMGFENLYGIEPQGYAVEFSKSKTMGINIIQGNAFDIPFKDGYFDLVFTSGVLIHINPKNVKSAIKEICRCSCKYIWGFEYYSEDYKNVVYRGHENLLWKADFSRIYKDACPGLKTVKQEFFKYLSNDNTDAMFLLKKRV
jgi:pseudaminic acid biosynthesis-associated methylase